MQENIKWINIIYGIVLANFGEENKNRFKNNSADASFINWML